MSFLTYPVIWVVFSHTNTHMHAPMRARTHTHMYTHTDMHAHKHTCMHAHMQPHTHTPLRITARHWQTYDISIKLKWSWGGIGFEGGGNWFVYLWWSVLYYDGLLCTMMVCCDSRTEDKVIYIHTYISVNSTSLENVYTYHMSTSFCTVSFKTVPALSYVVQVCSVT